MNNYKTKKLIGILYSVAGIMLIIWSSAILIKVLIFIVGLMLLNTGLQLLGQRSLWSYGSLFLFSRFKPF